MVIWLYTHVLKPHFHTNSLKLFYKISDIVEPNTMISIFLYIYIQLRYKSFIFHQQKHVLNPLLVKQNASALKPIASIKQRSYPTWFKQGNPRSHLHPYCFSQYLTLKNKNDDKIDARTVLNDNSHQGLWYNQLLVFILKRMKFKITIFHSF